MNSRQQLIEAMAIDTERHLDAGLTYREAVERLFEIPELEQAMQLREEKLKQDRAMRGGL